MSCFGLNSFLSPVWVAVKTVPFESVCFIKTESLSLGLSNLKLYVADIKQINSHFARWRLGYEAKYLEIHPYKNALENFSKQSNVVFLITVLEHLPDPLNVVKSIHASLKSGGFLIFDYLVNHYS